MSRGPTVKQLRNYCRPRRCPQCRQRVQIWPCLACVQCGPARPMPAGNDPRFEIPLQELELTANVRDRLEYRGYLFAGQLLMVRPLELADTPGLGMSVLRQVRAALAQIGFGTRSDQAA